MYVVDLSLGSECGVWVGSSPNQRESSREIVQRSSPKVRVHQEIKSAHPQLHSAILQLRISCPQCRAGRGGYMLGIIGSSLVDLSGRSTWFEFM